MNLSKIHHIAIIVSDYEAAKDFYVNKLGFSVIRENYRSECNPFQGFLLTGAFHLRLPTGASAYGIPLYKANPSW